MSEPDYTPPVAFKVTALSDARERKTCFHGGKMLIDPETRLVQCGLCNRWIDAFTALEVLTREWQRQVQATEWAKLEADAVARRLLDLKREERNTKARLRRARAKLERLAEIVG